MKRILPWIQFITFRWPCPFLQVEALYLLENPGLTSVDMSASPLPVVSPFADIRDSFGAAFIGLIISTTSVIPWVFFYVNPSEIWSS